MHALWAITHMGCVMVRTPVWFWCDGESVPLDQTHPKKIRVRVRSIFGETLSVRVRVRVRCFVGLGFGLGLGLALALALGLGVLSG